MSLSGLFPTLIRFYTTIHTNPLSVTNFSQTLIDSLSGYKKIQTICDICTSLYLQVAVKQNLNFQTRDSQSQTMCTRGISPVGCGVARKQCALEALV